MLTRLALRALTVGQIKAIAQEMKDRREERTHAVTEAPSSGADEASGNHNQEAPF